MRGQVLLSGVHDVWPTSRHALVRGDDRVRPLVAVVHDLERPMGAAPVKRLESELTDEQDLTPRWRGRLALLAIGSLLLCMSLVRSSASHQQMLHIVSAALDLAVVLRHPNLARIDDDAQLPGVGRVARMQQRLGAGVAPRLSSACRSGLSPAPAEPRQRPVVTHLLDRQILPDASAPALNAITEASSHIGQSLGSSTIMAGSTPNRLVPARRDGPPRGALDASTALASSAGRSAAPTYRPREAVCADTGNPYRTRTSSGRPGAACYRTQSLIGAW